MNDGVQRNSPDPVPSYGVTDEQLAAELMKAAGKRPVHHPVGELLGRHWEAAYSYARLCADGAHPAGMLTTAAFTRLFEESARQGGPTAAWRPPLLVTIRRLAGEWDTDHRRALLRPALRSGAGSAARAAARLLPPENRRLIAGVPAASRADPLSALARRGRARGSHRARRPVGDGSGRGGDQAGAGTRTAA
ncbi:hypothetical protein ACWDA7_40070 [Streptomyces sp. NPDC001156]